MGIMALITEAIGVHTVFGAFVAGILVGQSPILTRHIDEQLRGLITALFMPVFFGVAGLTADLRVLGNPSLLLLAIGFIAIASLGKFTGAFICGGHRRPDVARVAGSWLGHERPWLDRGHRRVLWSVDGRTKLGFVHDYRNHGGGHDDGDAPMLRWALARLPLRPDEREDRA